MLFGKKINGQRNVKHLLLRKTDAFKTCRKSKFLGKKLKKCNSFEEQKDTRYIWGKVYFEIIDFSCLLSTKPCFFLISFNLFCSGIC